MLGCRRWAAFVGCRSGLPRAPRVGLPGGAAIVGCRGELPVGAAVGASCWAAVGSCHGGLPWWAWCGHPGPTIGLRLVASVLLLCKGIDRNFSAYCCASARARLRLRVSQPACRTGSRVELQRLSAFPVTHGSAGVREDSEEHSNSRSRTNCASMVCKKEPTAPK